MPPPTAGVSIQCSPSPGFIEWLSQAGGTLAVTTYQADKVALIGWDGRQVILLLRQFPRPMGLAVHGRRLALATRHAVLLFADAPTLAASYPETEPGRYDGLYLPRALHLTGDLNLHDLAFAGEELWLVNTRFSCLATLSAEQSFVPRWQPRFLSALAPEDRCHLNGLALVDDRPGYVTVLGETDSAGAWRANRAAGGSLIDVPTGEPILRGLSMPHSPRWHQGKLWLLSSGTGELWQVDVRTRTHTALGLLPGYARGLCFVGDHAVIGLSQIREKHTFGGLPLQQRQASLVCGVAVLSLQTGQLVGLLEFTAGCREIYDVQFLPGLRRPTILNLEREASWHAVITSEASYWIRPDPDGGSRPVLP